MTEATAPVPFSYLAQVRWSDVDIMGHVNHARYLSFFEDARMTMLSASPAGLAGASGDRGYIAARVAVDYQSPATFRPGLMLRVDTLVARIGTTSWTFDQRMFDDVPADNGAGDGPAGGTPIARCECVLVGYSYSAGRSRPLDDDERAYWSLYLDQAR